MGGVVAAYLAAVGLVSYRWITGPKQAPPPITLVGAGGVFAGVALLGNADERLGNAAGWAVVLALFFAPKAALKPVQGIFEDGSLGAAAQRPAQGGQSTGHGAAPAPRGQASVRGRSS